MLSRRQFLQSAAALGAATFFWRGDVLYARSKDTRVLSVVAQIPGGTLNPKAVPKFVTPLVIPPAMPDTGTADEYSITVKQFSQQILPAGVAGPTTVWSYGASNQLGTLNYPAFTIEAKRNTPTTITWINGLVDESGNYLPHLLPVDPTLHWANPPGGVPGRDMRPTFTATPGMGRPMVPNTTRPPSG